MDVGDAYEAAKGTAYATIGIMKLVWTTRLDQKLDRQAKSSYITHYQRETKGDLLLARFSHLLIAQ